MNTSGKGYDEMFQIVFEQWQLLFQNHVSVVFKADPQSASKAPVLLFKILFNLSKGIIPKSARLPQVCNILLLLYQVHIFLKFCISFIL